MAQLFEITQLLTATLDGSNPTAQKAAEQQLNNLREQNYDAFLLSLSAEVSNDHKPSEARQVAGLILKNTLYSKDPTTKEELYRRWGTLQPDVRYQIKNAMLQALGAQNKDVANTAALVISQVSVVDFLQKQWPELVPSLTSNMQNPQASPGLKIATLEALGYVCEETCARADSLEKVPSDLVDQTDINSILTAIVTGAGKDVPTDIRKAAVEALCNALEFADINFKAEAERNYLMTVVCDAAAAPQASVRQAAYSSLVKVAEFYYEFLDPYMPRVYELTMACAQQQPPEDDDEEFAKNAAQQALEFWCTICEHEMEEGVGEAGEDAATSGKSFIQKVHMQLVPVLLQLLMRQEEGQDEDEGSWNISMQAGACLKLIAQTVGDDCVDQVIGFVMENITKAAAPSDWRNRDAAIYALGSIMVGPTLEKLGQFVNQGLPFLLSALKTDPSFPVRCTTADAIAHVFEFMQGSTLATSTMLTTETLPKILDTLAHALTQDHPRVAAYTCSAIQELMYCFDGEEETNMMTPMLQQLAATVFRTVDRPDSHLYNLRVDAYVVLNDLIYAAAMDALQVVIQMVPEILLRISHSLQMPVASAAEQQHAVEVQSELCGVLSSLLGKLNKVTAMAACDMLPAKTAQMIEEMRQHVNSTSSDKAMEVLLQVLNKHESVHEAALQAAGHLAMVVKNSFARYMDAFYPFVQKALANTRDWQACKAAVGVITDLCDALSQADLFKYLDNMMELMLKALHSPELQRDVKPNILGVFGDIANTIDEHFFRYFPNVLAMIQGAMQLSENQRNTTAESHDEDLVEYNNYLRDGIVSCCDAIIMAFAPQPSEGSLVGNAREVYSQLLPSVLQFSALMVQDRYLDDGLKKSTLNMLGDIAHIREVSGVLKDHAHWILKIIREWRQEFADEEKMLLRINASAARIQAVLGAV